MTTTCSIGKGAFGLVSGRGRRTPSQGNGVITEDGEEIPAVPALPDGVTPAPIAGVPYDHPNAQGAIMNAETQSIAASTNTGTPKRRSRFFHRSRD